MTGEVDIDLQSSRLRDLHSLLIYQYPDLLVLVATRNIGRISMKRDVLISLRNCWGDPIW